MWKFAPASDSDGHPLLRSLNNNIGRQVWVYDPEAGTPEERAAVEEAREKFAANRLTQKHSSDALLRQVRFPAIMFDDVFIKHPAHYSFTPHRFSSPKLLSLPIIIILRFFDHLQAPNRK